MKYIELNQKCKNLLKMLLDNKRIQFLEEGTNIWVDFDSAKHGALIFADDETRHRIRPQEKAYYYARFTDGSRTEIADSLDKAEVIANGEVKGGFVIEKMIHDISFNYEVKDN